MSDFMNQNHLQCSANSTITDISSISSKMNRLVAFVTAFVVNFIFGFTLIILKKLLAKTEIFLLEEDFSNLSIDDDNQLIKSMSPYRGRHRTVSCPPTHRRFQPLLDPSTLTVKQLQDITENDETTESESAAEYGSGGYMPISIEQRFGPSNKYEVKRKLGWGHFSTVWLCEDMSQGHKSHKYYAIKIVKSSRMFRNVALDEIRLLNCIKEKDKNSVGYDRIILLHEHFTEISMNGAHTCLTFEIMGPSLLELLTQSYFQGLQQSGVKRIIKQVLEGLMYLHEVCRIIHTDIKPENILIKVKDAYVHNMVGYVNRFREVGAQMPRSYVSAIRWEEHVELYGQASCSRGSTTSETLCARSTSLPQDIHAKKLSKSSDKRQNNESALLFIDPNIQVKIADLGNACWETKHFATVIQTIQYRALEVIIDAGYSFPADMWSLACVAFEISTGEYLFNPHASQQFTSSDDHLGQIWEVLDGIPKYIAQSGRNSRDFFDSTGALRRIKRETMKIWKVEDVLVDKYGWKRVDAILFADFIQSLIEPDPDLRATASQALNNKWFKELDNN